MTFFEFVSVVQKHFKNCEIQSAQFTPQLSRVKIKPEFYQRFTQVALVNGCKQDAIGDRDLGFAFVFELDNVRFSCVPKLESASC